MTYFNIIRKRVLEAYLMELENAYDIMIREKTRIQMECSVLD